MELSTQNLRTDVYPGEIHVTEGASAGGGTRTLTVTAGLPNSLQISSRKLGDTESPIMADGHILQPGDIVLARARTVAMHAVITLGQIYKYSWDTDNSFRFWSHPAMIVAVAGQTLQNADGSKQGTVTEDVLVQATINPKGVNYALLKDFRNAYSSRCWVFSPFRFTEHTRSMVVMHAEIEAGAALFEWLERNGLLADITALPTTKKNNGFRRSDPRQFTYGLLSLASVLSCQVFQKWRFRFFNEGQVTCSGFIAELMEKANYVFPSEIHAFPGDVAEQLYADFQDHPAMIAAEASEERKGNSKDWTKGVANLRKQISDDRKVMLKNAGTFRISGRALRVLLSIAAIACVYGVAMFALLWPYMQTWPWVVSLVLAAAGIYAIAIAAPISYYALRAFLKLSFVGIPQLIVMLRPLYWRRPDDLK